MKLAMETLNEEAIVHKLTDYILLNSCSLSSSGLYNGKAGIALTLFEVAKYFNDIYIEERASELLRETLLTKNDDIGFENGLSGVGYVLLYLIENNFVDASFEELFGDNLFKITNVIKKWNNEQASMHLLSNLKVVYFLNDIMRFKPDEEITSCMEIISTTVESVLIKEFKEEYNGGFSYSSIRVNVLDCFKEYLKIAYHCESFNVSIPILQHYMLLYQKSRYVSNIFIGHYLHEFARMSGCKEMEAIANTNIRNEIRNIHPEIMLLSQQLELHYLLSFFYQYNYPEQIALLEKELFDFLEDCVRGKKLYSIQPSNCIVSYQLGIARFLLYWTYCKNDMNTSDYIYFKRLL